MKEIRDIINAFDNACSEGKQSALATVVLVEGSSYRRPGARMLITEDGELTGAISGGCLEGDAFRKARHVMMEKRSMLVTYDTMDEDDATLGLGLGCNGIIRVLIEPIDTKNPQHPIHFLKAVADQREAAVLITLFSLADKSSTQTGTCLAIKKNTLIGESEIAFKDVLMADGLRVLSERQSLFRNYLTGARSQSAFIELIEPAVSLVIAGAGNDVVPLVQMAEILGWNTTVIDGRPALARKERFSSGCRVMVARPELVINNLEIDDYTVFVLMTHNYLYDRAMLEGLVQKNARYIGMLGPRKKLERMLSEMKDEGTHLNEQQLASIHSPVGLDLGAETPEEIALSIVSEIKAVISGSKGLSLHKNTGSIHARDEWVEITVKSD